MVAKTFGSMTGMVRVVGAGALAGLSLFALGCPQGGLLTCGVQAANFASAFSRAQTAANDCNLEPPCTDFCEALADAETALSNLSSQDCFSEQFPELAGQLQQYQDQLDMLGDDAFAALGCE